MLKTTIMEALFGHRSSAILASFALASQASSLSWIVSFLNSWVVALVNPKTPPTAIQHRASEHTCANSTIAPWRRNWKKAINGKTHTIPGSIVNPTIIRALALATILITEHEEMKKIWRAEANMKAPVLS